ncbi:MAG: helix-turn-helix transcriptional regulator [Bdellovibrionaceae bacterium]|nr:helix-turn-helix transcriptional regulator [Pseudobdellovibrionaceae bacterium]
MTYQYALPEPKHRAWLKKEQGRFLKKARLRAGLSVRDVARKTGVDIRWVESGDVNLQVRNLAYLVRLYRVPPDYFMTWEQYVAIRIRQMMPPRLLH